MSEDIAHRWRLASAEGFEPPTGGFGDRCSARLSYADANFVLLATHVAQIADELIEIIGTTVRHDHKSVHRARNLSFSEGLCQILRKAVNLGDEVALTECHSIAIRRFEDLSHFPSRVGSEDVEFTRVGTNPHPDKLFPKIVSDSHTLFEKFLVALESH